MSFEKELNGVGMAVLVKHYDSIEIRAVNSVLNL